jgi:hypothetical protein
MQQYTFKYLGGDLDEALRKRKEFEITVKNHSIKKKREMRSGKSSYIDNFKVPSKKKRKNRNKKKTTFKHKLDNKASYNNYIKSSEWTNRRNEYFTTHAKICLACNSVDSPIHLHHGSYQCLRNEPDNHLFPLCNKCHEIFHRNFRTRKDMLYNTKIFIEHMQNGTFVETKKQKKPKKKKFTSSKQKS